MTATLYLRHKQDPQLANFNLKKEPLDHSWERKKVWAGYPCSKWGSWWAVASRCAILCANCEEMTIGQAISCGVLGALARARSPVVLP